MSQMTMHGTVRKNIFSLVGPLFEYIVNFSPTVLNFGSIIVYPIVYEYHADMYIWLPGATAPASKIPKIHKHSYLNVSVGIVQEQLA